MEGAIEGDASTTNKGVCFVSGVGRSGTTALGTLLNLHPQVCIGVERYKNTFLRRANPDPAMFLSERFFAFAPDETNITPVASKVVSAAYDAMRPKFRSALVVGDKIPHLGDWYERIRELFDGVKIVHLVREPAAVGRSWDRRAANKDDAWSSTATASVAITRWLHENRRALQFFDKHPGQIAFACYETLFSDDPYGLEHVCGFLGVSPTDAMRKMCDVSASRDLGSFVPNKKKPEGTSDREWEQTRHLVSKLKNGVLARPQGPIDELAGRALRIER